MVTGKRSIFGDTHTIGSGISQTFTSHLPGASGGAYLHKFKINAPGVSADTALYAYDGISGTTSTLIMGGVLSTMGSPVPLAASPTDGFIFDEYKFNRTEISTGSITLIFKNNTQASKNVYIAGEYTI